MNEVAMPNDTALMSFIERAAKDPDFDVAKFGELLRLQRDVGQDLARRSFNRAMAAAQSEMMPVIRSAQNKHLGNKYAKLEDIDREMRPIYTRHGFSVRFGSAPAPREGDMRITCTVAHEDGFFEENHLDAPATLVGSQGGRMAVTPVQAVGSVVTYLRRYLSTMVFNVVLADDDDDGEGSRRAAATATQRAPVVRGPVTYTDDQWQAWLVKTRSAMAVMRTREEVEQAAARESIKRAEDNGPEWLQRDLKEVLAEAMARFDNQIPDDGTEAHEPTTEDVA